MNFSKIKVAYFSATGTTQKVVRHLANHLSEVFNLPLEECDFTLPQQRQNPLVFNADELVVFGTPVYAGRVPNVLLKYLTTMQAEGAKAIAVVVYGNRDYDDALMELSDILSNAGAQVFAAGAFIGEHSFSYTLAAGRPDKDDFEKIETFAQQIVDKTKDECFTKPEIKGVRCPQHAKQFVDANYLFHKEDVERKNQRRAEAEWFV